MDFVGKFRFFTGIFTQKKSIFQDKFPKNFDFFQAISLTSLISEGKFLKNFDFLGSLTKNFDFLGKF